MSQIRIFMLFAKSKNKKRKPKIFNRVGITSIYKHNENQKSPIIECRCNVGSDDSWMVEWLFIFIILMYVF